MFHIIWAFLFIIKSFNNIRQNGMKMCSCVPLHTNKFQCIYLEEINYCLYWDHWTFTVFC